MSPMIQFGNHDSTLLLVSHELTKMDQVYVLASLSKAAAYELEVTPG